MMSEDVSRQSDNMSRTNRDFISSYTKNKLKTLNRQANYLGIKHFSLPIGMTRHQQNQKLMYSYVDQGRSIGQLNQSIIAITRNINTWNMDFQLKYFIDAGLHQFKVALKKEKAPKGHFVDITDVMDMSFLDILRGEVIVEYPTLHIWLKSDPQPTDILLLEEKRVLVRPLKRSRQEDDNIKEEGEKKQKLSIEEDDHITEDDQDENDNRVKEKDENELEVKDEDEIEAKEEYKVNETKKEGLSA
ncbi:hypothetical protein G6F46_009599 [Rhizopus delemar]|uniref:BCD1 alpha/beta domain-containing protein n=2 Tax=Rhizopus TaxID=4842 RepID=A0A9P7CKJ6_9FUNG|nr:hypothetical protein G6F55_009047 [Rhizopus delemar]KAG1537858.1 hypothetical protein G6F51_010122 [Rhizopus arrhizus]KAG1492196.1 hypothetical protein G6F54_009483 [Rhizopus delemar]KAG1506262.1 hypothetical protein G6F53_009820 [Rhizopus delemar]KAG1521426.1 hypothetical protein G6F52_006761 [Rhizopus delemar]